MGSNVVMACRPSPPPREPHPASVVDKCSDAAKAAGKVDSIIEYWEVDMASVASVEFVILPHAVSSVTLFSDDMWKS